MKYFLTLFCCLFLNVNCDYNFEHKLHLVIQFKLTDLVEAIDRLEISKQDRDSLVDKINEIRYIVNFPLSH